LYFVEPLVSLWHLGALSCGGPRIITCEALVLVKVEVITKLIPSNLPIIRIVCLTYEFRGFLDEMVKYNIMWNFCVKVAIVEIVLRKLVGFV
jgi:hypothetical protein